MPPPIPAQNRSNKKRMASVSFFKSPDQADVGRVNDEKIVLKYVNLPVWIVGFIRGNELWKFGWFVE